MKRSEDNRIGFWRVCAGLALVAGMFEFGQALSEPPITTGRELPLTSQQSLVASAAAHGAKP
jgi:hypothetical protein